MSKKKRFSIKTKNLLLLPLTPDEMEIRASSTAELEKQLLLAPSIDTDDEDIHLMAAYAQMRDACRLDPEHYLWYTDWLIILQKENRIVGSLGFKGVPNDKKEVEIGYGIGESDRRRGYALEAVKHAIDWAFSQENVYYVEAQTELENTASIGLLEKLEFKLTGPSEEGIGYELEKPKSSWVAVYMCLGLAVGMSIGLSLDNMSLGMCLGLAFGVGIGACLDSVDRKARIRKEKDEKESDHTES